MHSLLIKSIAICLLLCRLSMSGVYNTAFISEEKGLPAFVEAGSVIDQNMRSWEAKLIERTDDSEETKPAVEIVTDEQLDAGYLDEWLNGSVLVGDSLAAGFSGYVENERY